MPSRFWLPFLAAAAAISAAPPAGPTVSFRVRLGVNDAAPRAWDGSLSVQGGQVVNLRNWRPRPGDRVEGLSSWSLATRQGLNFVRRAWETEAVTAPVPYLLIPGLVVDVKASAATRVRFETRNGAFEVAPAELAPGRPRTLLAGAVVVERVPTADLLSGPESQDDYASMAAGPGGELWVVWVAYRDGKNQAMARQFDGSSWQPARAVNPSPGDIFLVKVARDGRGGWWFVWSEQVKGNWDLYARRFDGQSWSGVERLTSEPQPDIYHVLTTDSAGNPWLAWQGFRAGQSDIFARRCEGGSWQPAEKLSTSSANDWAPALAADSAGRVYAGWDTYAKGNYDVVLRRWEAGRWGEEIPVADTPKFEAHVSLACDARNRLWAAWNESGMQWGKDAGFLVKKEATRLYQSRWMAVAVLEAGRWREPAAEIESALPADLRGYNDLPLLAGDGAGRVWLLFRHRLLRIRDVPNDAAAHRAAWELFATSYEGGHWTTPIPVPFSPSRTDSRAGFASGRPGTLYAAWVNDNRDYEEFLVKHFDVYAARIPTPAAAPPEPKLVARSVPKLTTFPPHVDEAAAVERVRGYAIQSEGRTYRIYRGDTHRHTEFSMDGHYDGSLLDAYRYALDAAQMEFLLASDHNGAGGPDVEYINYLLQQMADVFHVNGRFTPFYGYERSVGYPNGHRNILFAKRGHPTLPIPPAEQKARIGARPLYEYLRRLGGIAISHTSATGMGTDWRDNDPEVEPLVEIYQGDRVSAEYEGAPKAAHAANPASAPGGFRPAGYVWNAWAKGYKLGVQASSDHLSTHISYACTLAEELTREGLIEAMRRRHSYGATDNIILDYRVQTGGREYLQGDIVKPGGEVRFTVKVIGTTPIRQIDVVRNNRFVHNRQPLEREVSFSYVDSQPLPGESYYYVRVIQADDNMAWSSPIWLQR